MSLHPTPSIHLSPSAQSTSGPGAAWGALGRALVLVVSLLVSLLVLPVAVLAQTGVWAPQGPPGGPVTALAIAPDDSQLVYAGTRGSGLFRSTDGGTTWAELPGSPFRGPVTAVALDPARPARVFAALEGPEDVAGVYRSTNGGATWSRTLDGTFLALAVDPIDPEVLWAGAAIGVFRSEDGGITWEQVHGTESPVPVSALAVDPSDSAIVYAGSDGELLRTDDGGLTWTPLELPSSAGFVQALAVHPSDSTTVYAGAEGGMFRSTDGGVTWTGLGAGPFSVADLVLDPDDPAVLHLAGARVVFDPPAVLGVFRSTDGGDTWTSVSEGLVGDPLALAFDPQDPERLLAGTTEGAFLRTATGEDWARADDGLNAHPIRDLDVPTSVPNLVFAVDAFGQAFQSGGGGEFWLPISDHVFSLTPHPHEPSRVYGHSNLRRPFLVSRDLGLTFESVDFAREPGFRQSVGFHDIAVDPTDPDTLYVGSVFTSLGGFQISTFEDVHRSTNGGQTWESGWMRPTLAARDLAVDPFDPSLVYAATDQGLRVSHNAGATWDPPAPVPLLPATHRVVPDPAREGRLWLAGETSVIRSDDRGGSAVRVDTELPEGRVLDLTTDPTAGVVYALIEDRGVFRSADGGATWTSVTGNLLRRRLTGPLVVSTPAPALPQAPSPRTLRVGTATGVRALTGPPACTPGPATLCLLGNRFQVTVEWRDFQSGTGVGRTRAVTDDTGAFWFFDASNLELMVKVIDGRPVNGHFWVFYGSLSNVGFDLSVTDTATGVHRVFTNSTNRFASAGITTAFPGDPDATGGAVASAGDGSATSLRSVETSAIRNTSAGGFIPCGASTNLCLQNDRFRVEVVWRDFEGNRGSGHAVPLTPDTGAFWFFDSDNLELMVKVLDGRPINGHFWVFLGSLTNVRFEVRVTDISNGRSWVYENPAGTFASLGDARAFTDAPPGPTP